MTVFYNSFHVDILKSMNLETDTIKLMLVSSSYTPDVDAHSKRSHITNEVTGANYPAGGFVLSGKAITQNNTTNKAEFSADAIVIPATSLNARGGVYYKSRGGLATADEVIAYADFGADIISTNSDFNISATLLTFGQSV